MPAPTAVVTGANRGIGLELARALAAEGYTVLGTAREPSEADELRSVAEAVLPLDHTDESSVDAFAAGLDGRPLDLLINNGAMGGSPREPLGKIDTQELVRFFDVNAVGPVRVTQALLGNLRAGSHKRIVNVSSQLGSITNTDDSFSYGYRASKTALNMLTRRAALELADEGFTAVVMHPGWVRTRMGGDEAPLLPADSAAGMVRVITSLTTEQNGAFLQWNGQSLPW